VVTGKMTNNPTASDTEAPKPQLLFWDFEDRIIIQYLGFSFKLLGDVEDGNFCSHTSCLVKHGGNLSLLVASEDGPVGVLRISQLP
jgi:hypothetical protein